MNPSIPIFDSGKDGLLEVKKGPDVKRSGSDCSSNGVQGSDQAGILASRELVLLVQHDRVEALAKQAPALAARNEELHLDTVDLSAQHFDRLSRVDLNLVGMNAEAQPVEQIDCELGISNGLRAAASTAPNIVDVSHTSDLPSAEISNCRQQEVCCDTRS